MCLHRIKHFEILNSQFWICCAVFHSELPAWMIFVLCSQLTPAEPAKTWPALSKTPTARVAVHLLIKQLMVLILRCSTKRSGGSVCECLDRCVSRGCPLPRHWLLFFKEDILCSSFGEVCTSSRSIGCISYYLWIIASASQQAKRSKMYDMYMWRVRACYR